MRSLQFIKTIGAGAFGTVYLCRLSTAQGFQSHVAVKVLQDQVNAGMFLSRMRDEARLLGLLQDAAIIKVMDLVTIHGRQAVVMEYVEGADLESIVESQGPPPARALAEIGAAVAGALRRAHMAVHPSTREPLNVIHRDVKPANIMVSNDGAVKLLDFGVARARFDARESLTGQLVLGTLNYMAPEYIVTGQVSQAVDVYGLGLSLWQAATGKVFGQPKVRMKDHELRIVERLAELSGTHEGLGPAIKQMLQWDPESRPTSAIVEDLLDDALSQLDGQGLRTWSKETIPRALAAQSSPLDEQGLVGTEVQIDETEEHLDTTTSLDDEETARHTAPLPPSSEACTAPVAPVDDATEESEVTEASPREQVSESKIIMLPGASEVPGEASPRGPGERTESITGHPIRRVRTEAVTVPILVGLLIGTTIGLVLLLGMVLFFLGDRI